MPDCLFYCSQLFTRFFSAKSPVPFLALFPHPPPSPLTHVSPDFTLHNYFKLMCFYKTSRTAMKPEGMFLTLSPQTFCWSLTVRYLSLTRDSQLFYPGGRERCFKKCMSATYSIETARKCSEIKTSGLGETIMSSFCNLLILWSLETLPFNILLRATKHFLTRLSYQELLLRFSSLWLETP